MQVLEPSDAVAVRCPIVVADSTGYRVVKRCLDLGLCILFLPLLLPLFALAGLAVRLDSRGPALFVQARVGMAGRVIRVYKFRTMAQGIDRAAVGANRAAWAMRAWLVVVTVDRACS